MKKVVLSSLVLSGLLHAQNSTISYEYGIKDYENSMTKVDGKVQNIGISHKITNHQFFLGYQGDNVNRKHAISNAILPSLDVEKYSVKYIYKLNDKIKLKTSYIKIIDNLAPTDQGKVYGIGGSYNFDKGFNSSFNIYKSDYKTFDVNEYDLSISKGFKINDIKLKAMAIVKKIDINGNKYGSYVFKEKEYFTTGLNLGANYNGYFGAVGAFFGERAFTVLDDGMKVQHHAMKQDETYMIKLGKKFKNFDIYGKYSFQNGKELPENKDNVDTKVLSFALTYKF